MKQQARFYTTEQIGAKRGFTPEGFLVCYDVPLARVGTQLYMDGEIPTIEAGPDGLIRVERPEDEVFRSETIASFNGKVVVVEHPVDEEEGPLDVNPQNWREFTVGSVQNPRRGTGVDIDVMLGDLVIYDPEAISLVQTGRKREVSCGYDAEYIEVARGQAVQRNIVGNHVALVDHGRCGPLCAIRDSKPVPGEKRVRDHKGDKPMPTLRSLIRDITFRASRVKDAEELEELQKEAARKIGDAVETETSTGNTGEPGSTPEGESLHIHLHGAGGSSSAGAGGSASTGDDEPAGAGGAGGGGDRLGAIEKCVADLTAKLDAILAAIGGEMGGGEMENPPGGGMSDPEQDGMLSIQHGDTEGEERFEPQVNKKISTAGFGAEAPPGAAGALNKGSRDRGRGRDSNSLATTWEETMALAEIISPGVRLPTFDRSAHAVNTIDAMCKFRRRVLNTAYDTDAEMHNVLDNLVDSPNGYSPGARMTCDSVTSLFRAAAQIKRDRNNLTMGRDGGANGGVANFYGSRNVGLRASSAHSEADALAEMNRRNRERASEIWGTGASA